MIARLQAAAVLGALLLVTGCRDRSPAPTEKVVHCDVHVQITPETGELIDRTFSSEDQDALAALDAEIGDVTGTMVATIKVRHPDIDVAFEIQIRVPVVHGKPEGRALSFSLLEDRWHLMSECVYHEGIQNGPFVMYSLRTGTKFGEGYLKDGKHNGDHTYYYPSGAVLARTRYEDGSFDGRCEIFSEAGDVLASGTYRTGEPEEGTFVEDLNAYLLACYEGRQPELNLISKAGKSTPIPVPADHEP
jgi:hypothetical protein